MKNESAEDAYCFLEKGDFQRFVIILESAMESWAMNQAFKSSDRNLV